MSCPTVQIISVALIHSVPRAATYNWLEADSLPFGNAALASMVIVGPHSFTEKQESRQRPSAVRASGDHGWFVKVWRR